MTEPIAPPSVVGTIGRVVAFLLLLAVSATLAGVTIAPALTWLVARTGQRLRIDFYVALAGALAATWFMLRMVDHRDWRAVDMSREAAHPRLLVVGWLVGTGAIVVTCALLFATGLLRVLPVDAATSWVGAATRVTVVLLPAALAEEIVCRGYLLSVLREGAGTRTAVLLTSAAFALLHIWNPGATVGSVLVVLLAGVFLATVRLALGSLYAAWMAHLAWNWVMAVPLHAAVSGERFEAPGYRAVMTGPDWLSGGAWGPEGGLVAALGMAAGLGYFYARHRREES